MILFLRLLLAHLIADFLFQPNSWVKHKNQYGIKSVKLFYHILIVTLLSVLFTLDYFTWEIPAFIFGFHYLIDLGKIHLKPTSVNNLIWFLLDQFVHLLLILFLSVWVEGAMPAMIDVVTDVVSDELILVYVLAYFIMIWPSMIVINLATKRWQKQINQSMEPNLVNAGKWIGILERVLVLTFILIAQYQAIGFLIAAKSILRISVKSEANARILSEYVLIGTLISFAIAILVGVAIKL